MLLLFSRGGGGPTTPVPSPTYTLSWWQEIEFASVVDLWEPSNATRADGDKQPVTYTHRWTNVPCFERHNKSAGNAEPFGRTEQDDLFTRAEYHFHQHQQIGDSWLIILRTVDLEGDHHPDYGVGWIASGQPEIFVDQYFDEGFMRIVAIQEPKLPSGVS